MLIICRYFRVYVFSFRVHSSHFQLFGAAFEMQQGGNGRAELYLRFDGTPTISNSDCDAAVYYGFLGKKCTTNGKTNSGMTNMLTDLHAVVHAYPSFTNKTLMCEVNFYGVIVLEDGVWHNSSFLDANQEYILRVAIKPGSSKKVTCFTLVSWNHRLNVDDACF